MRREMMIPAAAGEDRRFAYGDSQDGYFEGFSSSFLRGDGYIRGDDCLFKDFFISLDGRHIFRDPSWRAEIYPEGILLLGPDSLGSPQLFFSLLSASPGIYIKLSLPAKSEPRRLGIGLALPAGSHAEKHETQPLIHSFKLPHRLHGSFEAALASRSHLVLSRHAHEIHPGECFLLQSAGTSSELEIYIAFDRGGSQLELRERVGSAALSLLESNSFSLHQSRLEAIMDAAVLESGDPGFDAALRWAAASSSFFVTKEFGTGIWAGLPWFRDNWGRDTFIALPGVLLCRGAFDEARDVIQTFAEYQDKNPVSPTYGRVPNRVHGPKEIIYNTVDGTPWFVREVFEYLQYSGDVDFAQGLFPTVALALDSDLARCDALGFLTHADADTWMDAKIDGCLPWSARGNRAVEVQALFYTALLAGSRLALLCGDASHATAWQGAADLLKKNFKDYYWNEGLGLMADRLEEEGPERPPEDGAPIPPAEASCFRARVESFADYRIRPNQLMALSVPDILEGAQAANHAALISDEIGARITYTAVSSLLYPHGMASLSQEDPCFHPYHENPAHYHKDAAYHNGTVWLWNSGLAISALCRYGQQSLAWRHALNLRDQILHGACPGSLSENSSALTKEDGSPIYSGTWSQAWSDSEFIRSTFQDFLGFKPRLLESSLILEPSLPDAWDKISARLPFGRQEEILLKRRVEGGQEFYELQWQKAARPHSSYALELPEELNLEFRPACAKGRFSFRLRIARGKGLSFSLDPQSAILSGARGHSGSLIRPLFPEIFQGLDFAQPLLHDWIPSVQGNHWLQGLIECGQYQDGPCASLAGVFSTQDFRQRYHYEGRLGLDYAKDSCLFRLWAPTASAVELRLYAAGNGGEPEAIHQLRRIEQGAWELRLPGDLDGRYYSYRVTAHGISRETADPYAQAVGLGGMRGMVLDLSRTNPPGWEEQAAPALANPAAAVIYEAHIRDLTSSEDSGVDAQLRCSFLGAAQKGCRLQARSDITTGFDHIRELGVSHVQLLPIYDFDSVDEARRLDPDYCAREYGGVFNWGYDPQNYNAPEGSYSLHPERAEARITELKTLIQAFNTSGIGVIMDVVYNHVPDRARFSLEACVPGYFFRMKGSSGAGSDTASQRSMMRKFMVDSTAYWLSQYKLSGFRFDLMGLHDLDTMKQILENLRRIKPDVLVYGEGWAMYPDFDMVPASMNNISQLEGIGMFNDAFRCAIKGSVFSPQEKGWIHDGRRQESVKFGLVGAVRHPQVRNLLVEGTSQPNPWSEHAWQSLSYTEVHDNLTLADKLSLAEPSATEERREALARVALGLVLLSQGMPILHAGMEFMRSKELPQEWLAAGKVHNAFSLPDGSRAFSHNSYSSSDRVNGIRWSGKVNKAAFYAFVRNLVRLRREQPLFQLDSGQEIRQRLRFIKEASGFLAFSLDGQGLSSGWKRIVVAANVTDKAQALRLGGGSWQLVCDGRRIDPEALAECSTLSLKVPPLSLFILCRK